MKRVVAELLTVEVLSLIDEAQGFEHSSEESLKQYLKQHPNADPKKHWVSDKGKAPEQPKLKSDLVTKYLALVKQGTKKVT